MGSGLLLDSNALIWWSRGEGALSNIAAERLRSPSEPLFVSVASAWELEIKRQSGKLILDGLDWKILALARIEMLTIDLQDALAAARLPPPHRDPFDRTIIAQALNRGLTIVTRDRGFDLYGVSILPA